MDDLLREFLTETNESLDVVDIELVKFEQEPNNAEILDNIFRLVHTVKGTCGFLGLPRLEALAHAAETLMGQYRDGMKVTDRGVTVILQSIDRLKEILAGLEKTESEPEGVDGDLIDQLVVLSSGQDESPPCEPEPEPAPGPDGGAFSEEEGFDPVLGRTLRPGEVSSAELEQAFAQTEVDTEPVIVQSPAESAFPSGTQEEVQDSSVRKKQEAVKPVRADGKENSTENDKGKKEGPVSAQSIRVNVDTLENLMTMVSELVLTRNQLLEMVRRIEDSEFKVPLQRLSNVTGELQEAVMKTRMQPIGNAWQKLPRIVRDLSVELDKKIELEMVGAETELDRQVLDLIKDPLTHMVRNSADHGLETTEERIRAGKPEAGKITLGAYHEGGHIIVDIADDGKGLDVDNIRKKAIANGLVSEVEAGKLSEQQIFRYIFSAGFSTAQEVTSVSGRGVGMDVVRTNIELIGGSVDLRSVRGEGTTFTIKIPLTLAIVSALIVEAAGERFAIPQLAVVELVRARSDSDHRIEHINDTPVLRLRNRLLPLVFMDQFLDIKNEEEIKNGTGQKSSGVTGEEAEESRDISVSSRRTHSDEAFIVVMQVGDQTFGIVVDSVFDTEEIVVKPVASLLRDITVFSGNTILGDGSVIMILDPNGVVQTISGELGENTENRADNTNTATEQDFSMSLLIFRAGSEEPKAVPLSLVTRLEEISIGEMEKSNGLNVVQYRGRLMPLIHVAGETPLRDSGRQPVLVFTEGERSVGLAVDEIVDIVTDNLNVELQSEQPGVLGSSIICGKATEILDVGHYLTRVFSDWFHARDRAGANPKKKTVLLVDDSAFFRTMLTPQLMMAGYQVVHASSPGEALRLREAGTMFDVIISDIEMPGMNGFAFARAIKEKGAWSDIPVVALSSHGTVQDIERGREAGFDDYVAKFDQDGLVEVLSGFTRQDGEAA